MKVRYAELATADPAALADFYRDALDFSDPPSGEEKWLSGPGRVLSAPGCPAGGPVFGFVQAKRKAPLRACDRGYAHVCFETRDVRGSVGQFVRRGGTIVSRLPFMERQPAVYCADPEGNLVEFHIPFPKEGAPSEYALALGSALGLEKDRRLRFLHVNIVTPDWAGLCGFYRSGFLYDTVGRLRDYSGRYIGGLTGLPGVSVTGKHVWLTGYGYGYPTLEIFTYTGAGSAAPGADGDSGFRAIGFAAADMERGISAVVSAGGVQERRNGDRAELLDVSGNKIIIMEEQI
jgi:catechol 2,3-dioxygenase-like lactoylglutathione lyase family enzyme